jgi:hypothetical protein
MNYPVRSAKERLHENVVFFCFTSLYFKQVDFQSFITRDCIFSSDL